jgi:hypothetical protein
MCTAAQYRATATEFKLRADSATAADEKRGFQDLERSFTTLADNEQWLSDNHDKTVHARERPSVSTASVPTGQYLLRSRANSTHPPSLTRRSSPVARHPIDRIDAHPFRSSGNSYSEGCRVNVKG